VVGLADAWVDTAKGVVIVTTVPAAQYSPGRPGQFPKGVHHGYDIPIFFFFDLQQNAADRAPAYFAATMVPASLIVEPDAGYGPFYGLIASAHRIVSR
jgi:hypothetical protein